MKLPKREKSLFSIYYNELPALVLPFGKHYLRYGHIHYQRFDILTLPHRPPGFASLKIGIKFDIAFINLLNNSFYGPVSLINDCLIALSRFAEIFIFFLLVVRGGGIIDH